jgi:2'-5' RNA ligase
MRAFVAVDCSSAAPGVARAREPFVDRGGLRPTDPEQAHLTLRFLGDVEGALPGRPDRPEGTAREPSRPSAAVDASLGEYDVEGLSTLVGALESTLDASGVGPFDCSLGGYGVFPSLDDVSVVWLGVESGGEALARLAAACESAVTDLGFDPADHAFTPHVTLARMDHAVEKDHVRRVVTERHPEAGTVHVDAVHLVESTLTDDGPTYESVARLPL